MFKGAGIQLIDTSIIALDTSVFGTLVGIYDILTLNWNGILISPCSNYIEGVYVLDILSHYQFLLVSS